MDKGLFLALLTFVPLLAFGPVRKVKTKMSRKPLSAPQVALVTAGRNNIKRSAVSLSAPSEPTIFTKFFRRLKVFQLAFRIFLDYQLAKRQERKLMKKLKLEQVNDVDDHPEIISMWNEVHERNAANLTLNIKNLEGFWVKVGQYLSTRADIMPAPYLAHLSSLQDSMPARPWAETWSTIERSLSNEELELLEYIDPQPLATASLAQVHRGTLKVTATDQKKICREIVIKVQHCGVASLMIQDMSNLRLILNTIAYFEPEYDFSLIIKEYNTEVRKELDFRIEAENMEEIRKLLKKNNVKVIVPKSKLAKEKVLIMDYCDGFPVRDIQLLDTLQVDKKLLLERVCKAWAIQLHVGGVFNADPHLGNVLVSTLPQKDGDKSIPVLLDFGLTKRLKPSIKVAFSRLMYSSYETDVDGLIKSFNEMGLKMNRYDPFEDMASMQRSFGETVPLSQARQIGKENSVSYQRRLEAMKEDQGINKNGKLRNPVEAWPSELVFFGRVTAMLKGMCSHLNIRHPYLKTMAGAACKTLIESVPEEERAKFLIHPSANEISSPLQKKLIKLIERLHDGNSYDEVGFQLCVMHKGKHKANIAAGTLGKANPRPVTPSTLFNIFSVSKGLLSIGLLKLLEEKKILLDDPVSKYWTEFGIKDITIRHVLSHQAGLANALPYDATIDDLLNWSKMKKYVESRVDPDHKPGTETQYHYLTYAWICGGIIEEVTGQSYDEYFEKILSESGINGDLNLFIGGLPNFIDENKLAVLSIDKNSQNNVKKDVRNESPIRKDDHSERNGSKKKILKKYQGQEQLLNPSIFNMRKVRAAKLPSANGHASASSLAIIFDSLLSDFDEESVISSPLLTMSTINSARTSNSMASMYDQKEKKLDEILLSDSQASFGLGFQVHEFYLPSGIKARSIGHAGFGGSIVISIPECCLTIAFVTNHLKLHNSGIRRHVLTTVFEEYDLNIPLSIQN